MTTTDTRTFWNDRERVTTAFRDLRRQGFLARQHVACCGGCAAGELATTLRARLTRTDPDFAAKTPDEQDAVITAHPSVWTHGQDRASFDTDGDLGVRGGRGVRGSALHVKWSGDRDTIAAAFRAVGLDVDVPADDSTTFVLFHRQEA